MNILKCKMIDYQIKLMIFLQKENNKKKKPEILNPRFKKLINNYK